MLAVLGEASGERLPEQLVEPKIADALAQAVWTFDGKPYRAIAARGDCDATACHLSLQGAPDTADPEVRNDSYRFRIDPGTLEVTREPPDLGAFPVELNPDLDGIARAGVPVDRLAGLEYVSGRWLPPPEFGRFLVSYDDGQLEGGRTLQVLIDARLGAVILVTDGRS